MLESSLFFDTYILNTSTVSSPKQQSVTFCSKYTMEPATKRERKKKRLYSILVAANAVNMYGTAVQLLSVFGYVVLSWQLVLFTANKYQVPGVVSLLFCTGTNVSPTTASSVFRA